MLAMILTLGIAGLFARAIWTKKYAQTFLLLTPLFGVYACIVGIWMIHRDNAWPGVVLIALGLGTFVYADKQRTKAEGDSDE